MQWLTYLYWAFLTTCSAFIFWRGGPPERVGILIAWIASVASNLAILASVGIRFQQVEHGVFIVDLATAGAFLALALCADRFWPLWVAGIHLVGLATHAAMLMSPTVVPWVYAWIQGFWAYPIVALMVIGSVRHQKRLRRYGADRSWNSFLVAIGRMRQRTGPTG